MIITQVAFAFQHKELRVKVNIFKTKLLTPYASLLTKSTA